MYIYTIMYINIHLRQYIFTNAYVNMYLCAYLYISPCLCI